MYKIQRLKTAPIFVLRGTTGFFAEEYKATSRGNVDEGEEEEEEPVPRASLPVPGLGPTTPRRVSFASAEQVCVELVLGLTLHVEGCRNCNSFFFSLVWLTIPQQTVIPPFESHADPSGPASFMRRNTWLNT